jgi:hypothetical protein
MSYITDAVNSTASSASGGGGFGGFGNFTAKNWLGLGAAGAGLLPMLFGSGNDQAINSAIGNLKTQASQATDLGKQFGAQSSELFQPVAQYLKNVTSGDRQSVLQATMPERRRVIDQYSTAKQAIAQFTPRSGGQAAAGATLQGKEASDLADTTAQARQQAFGQEGNLAQAAATLGISEQQLAGGDLNAVLNALSTQQQRHAEAAGGLGSALGALAGFLLF